MAPGLEIRDVSELHFDPENPRLPEALHHGDEEEVIDFFLLQCNLIELMMSIAEKGYFYGEPLLVVPNQSGSGFTVVEGNRRLASLKVLGTDQDPPSMIKAIERVRSDAVHRPTEVPCLHFDRREDVLDYLGYRHITGPVTELFRSFDLVFCHKGETSWHRNQPRSSARKQFAWR